MVDSHEKPGRKEAAHRWEGYRIRLVHQDDASSVLSWKMNRYYWITMKMDVK
jgi:hypothetical protein